VARTLSEFSCQGSPAPTARRAGASSATLVGVDDRLDMALRTRFLRDGALWPVDVLSTGAARALGRRLLSDARRSGGGAFKANDHLYYKAHLIFDAVDELARLPSIVETVRGLLQSDDVLLWDASVPIKPPGGPMFPLHQGACCAPNP
jgi:hypothetical protein